MAAIEAAASALDDGRRARSSATSPRNTQRQMQLLGATHSSAALGRSRSARRAALRGCDRRALVVELDRDEQSHVSSRLDRQRYGRHRRQQHQPQHVQRRLRRLELHLSRPPMN